MEILLAHNYYKQPGGEDQCVAAEIAMLKANGHKVLQYALRNNAIDGMSAIEAAAHTVWNRSAASELRNVIRERRPQIVHFHNTFPLISPAAYYAAWSENVVVVQTLHNFRLMCANALFFRNGAVCEECVGKSVPLPGVLHKCYRDNLGATVAVTTMLATHRLLGTWQRKIDIYIALAEFSRRKFIECGLPADKVVVKSNFAYPDPGPAMGQGGYGIFVGRLAAEKGIGILLEGWRQLGGDVPLRIIGDGPLAPLVEAAISASINIQWVRSVPLEQVYTAVGEASFLVLPSQCYENFPRVIIEAFAKGTPAIVSRLGAMAEIVEDGCTGLHFTAGDPADLAAKVRQILTEPRALARMRGEARRTFAEKYTAAANHARLMAIYEDALAAKSRRARAH